MSEITIEADQIIVKPGKDVVASMADEFKNELKAQLHGSSGGITIDLEGVSMVDSVGIGVIIATHNSLSNQNRKLKVVNIAKDIYDLFTTMRLDRHFTLEAQA